MASCHGFGTNTSRICMRETCGARTRALKHQTSHTLFLQPRIVAPRALSSHQQLCKMPRVLIPSAKKIWLGDSGTYVSVARRERPNSTSPHVRTTSPCPRPIRSPSSCASPRRAGGAPTCLAGRSLRAPTSRCEFVCPRGRRRLGANAPTAPTPSPEPAATARSAAACSKSPGRPRRSRGGHLT